MGETATIFPSDLVPVEPGAIFFTRSSPDSSDSESELEFDSSSDSEDDEDIKAGGLTLDSALTFGFAMLGLC